MRYATTGTENWPGLSDILVDAVLSGIDAHYADNVNGYYRYAERIIDDVAVDGLLNEGYSEWFGFYGAIIFAAAEASVFVTDDIVAPAGVEKVELLFELLKKTIPGIDFGDKIFVVDLSVHGDNVVSMVNPRGIGKCDPDHGGCIRVDDRFLAEANLNDMEYLARQIVHEGLHRTYSVFENIMMGKDHPEIYVEARSNTDAHWDEISAELIKRYPK